MSNILYETATPWRYAVAAAIAALLAISVGLMAPVAATPLPAFAAFLPIFGTFVMLVEGLTAFLLIVQFHATRQPYLGGLAGAYGFVLVLAALQFLTFPGIFSKTGLLGATPQTAAWIWLFWHCGFALCVFLALLTRTRTLAVLPQTGLVLMLGAPLTAALLGCIALRYSTALPPVINHGAYALNPTGLPVIGAILLAIFACCRITRLNDLLSLWIAVALLASLCDTLLSSLAGARYCLGWYGGRLLSVVASSVLLFSLLFEFAAAYERLHSANNALRRKVMQDGLTGAFNRLYLAEQFTRELHRAIREHTHLSVVMIDIDHFKQLNDSLGHAVGDRCLIAVYGALRDTLHRPGDFLVRYGGEEFVAILPRTPEAGALVIAEAMRLAVSQLALARDDAGNTLTISLGVSCGHPAAVATSLEELLRRADSALYASKHAGRNQVSLWQPNTGLQLAG